MTTDLSRPALRTDDPRLDVWRAFLTAHARLFRRLDEELRAEHDLSLPEYDALLQLARAPDRRLRMSRLADLVLLSKSGVTRLIDRLEADGSVERNQCLSDARGAEAVLTQAGLTRLRTAASTHLAGIERYFLAHVDANEQELLRQAMGRIASGAGERSAAPCDPVVDALTGVGDQALDEATAAAGRSPASSRA